MSQTAVRHALAQAEGNVISLAACRRASPRVDFGGIPEARTMLDDRQRAITTLRGQVRPGALIYVVLRHHSPDHDWLVCDFYLIEGRSVACISTDVAQVIHCYDPEREIGVKLRRPRGTEPLYRLIDGILSTALFGGPDQIAHQIIG